MDTYYLSFDCATKTFAYILLKIDNKKINIDLDKIKNLLKIIQKKIEMGNITSEVTDTINTLYNNLTSTINIITGDCVDLLPGKSNNSVNTVQRIQLVSKFVKSTILPLIENIPNSRLQVLIEFQMSHNTQAKVVSIALISLFSDHNTHLINPSLKNSFHITDSGQYCFFIEKYKNKYDANKKHALFNFKEFERIFNQKLDISDNLKGHIADAFMQIWGYRMHNKN